MTVKPPASDTPRRLRLLRTRPLLAPLGVLGFTVAWVVLGAISDGYQMWDIVVPSYSPVAQPVSGLGLGKTAPIMNTAFVVGGFLVTLGTWAATQSWPTGRTFLRTGARALVSVSGVGMAICGLFTLESIMMHSLGFLLAVGAPAVGFILASVLTRRTDRGFSRMLLVAGPVAIGLLVTFLTTFDPTAAGDNEGVAGLVQRILITVVLGTITVMGVRAATGATSHCGHRFWPGSPPGPHGDARDRTMTAASTALVVGGGIAGPVTALALHRAGLHVELVESAPAGAMIGGAVLSLPPNGVEALRHVGAYEA